MRVFVYISICECMCVCISVSSLPGKGKVEGRAAADLWHKAKETLGNIWDVTKSQENTPPGHNNVTEEKNFSE